MRSLCIIYCTAFFSASVSMVGRAENVAEMTLQQAHEAALRNHPRISVADLQALAARQATREARAAYFPNVSANAVAVGTAKDNTRLAAIGGLNNPSIFERNAEGIIVSQLITDFGRTAHLVGSAKARAEAEVNNAQATREQILLAVDGAFYGVLEAQSVAKVAQQTIETRQSFLDQVTALASNKLRSDLDVSFARVNLEDSKLLLSKAHSDLQAALTRLSTLIGPVTNSYYHTGSAEARSAIREPQFPFSYHLVEAAMPSEVSTNISELVEEALKGRPELLRSRHERDAAKQFERAEKALSYPTIAAVGSAGVVPIHDPQLPDNYAAAGVTISVPLFAGGYYSGRQQEAALRAQAAQEAVRDQENNVIRDVRIAWLNAQNAFERLHISDELVDNAKRSADLAKARYDNGLSSVVEYNQAELNLVSAEITYTTTKYEYLLQRSALDFEIGSLR